MNINAVANVVYTYLKTKFDRVYRNKSVKDPICPYIVFTVESVINATPAEDLYINVNIYDDQAADVDIMEDLADLIDGNSDPTNPTGLNQRIINNEFLNLYFDREARQYTNPEELVAAHLINLRYNVRAYFK